MLTKEQLDAIKARVEIATPGEWVTVLNSGFQCVSSKGDDRDDVCEVTSPRSAVDADFIAHARQDVPALIAEVERLQRFEQKAIYAIEENRKLREAITQALEVVSDAEGELIERVERVLLDVLEGDDACL